MVHLKHLGNRKWKKTLGQNQHISSEDFEVNAIKLSHLEIVGDESEEWVQTSEEKVAGKGGMFRKKVNLHEDKEGWLVWKSGENNDSTMICKEVEGVYR